MRIVKSNSHGNGLEVQEGSNHYYKSAIAECGKSALQREVEGYSWFGVSVKQSPTLDYIEVPKFQGRTFTEREGIRGNEYWIRELVRFYADKWREKDKVAIHGDLCLCNCIFNDTVNVIDWEHFHWADKQFFGFDIVNMLFIHLHYEYRWWHRLGINWVSFLPKEKSMFLHDMLQLLGMTPFMAQPFTNASMYIKKYLPGKKFLLGRVTNEMLESLDWHVA